MKEFPKEFPEILYVTDDHGERIICSSRQECWKEEEKLAEGYGEDVDVDWEKWNSVHPSGIYSFDWGTRAKDGSRIWCIMFAEAKKEANSCRLIKPKIFEVSGIKYREKPNIKNQKLLEYLHDPDEIHVSKTGLLTWGWNTDGVRLATKSEFESNRGVSPLFEALQPEQCIKLAEGVFVVDADLSLQEPHS